MGTHVGAVGLFCPDLYSDIEDYAQILCKYLPKKLAVGTSDYNPSSNPNWSTDPSQGHLFAGVLQQILTIANISAGQP